MANKITINPENGSLVINDTLMIDPNWTEAEFIKSEAHQLFKFNDRKELLIIENVKGQKLILYFSFKTDSSLFYTRFTFSRGEDAPADYYETEEMTQTFMTAFKEIITESFQGYQSEENDPNYIRYGFPWGTALATVISRSEFTNLTITYKR